MLGDRLRGKSLQSGGSGFFNRQAGSAGVQLPGGGSFQKTIYGFRSNIKATIDGSVSSDGVLQKGLVSNIIPHVRTIRLVPAPITPVPGVTNGDSQATGRSLNRMSSPAMQVPYEDVQALQYSDPRDVEALGEDLTIYVN